MAIFFGEKAHVFCAEKEDPGFVYLELFFVVILYGFYHGKSPLKSIKPPFGNIFLDVYLGGRSGGQVKPKSD